MKKLYLSETDRKIAGVCGGIGQAYDIDSTLIRLLWVFITLVSGILPGVILYLVAIIVIPEGPSNTGASSIPPKPKSEDEDTTQKKSEPRGFAKIKEEIEGN